MTSTGSAPFAGNPVLPLTLALLPICALLANRGTVLLLALSFLAALWSFFRSRRLLLPAMTMAWAGLAALLLWGLVSFWWEYTHGLAVAKFVQLTGLIVGFSLVLGSVRGTDESYRRRLLAWTSAGIVAATLMVLVDWQADMAILRAIQRWTSHEIPTSSLALYKTGTTITAISAIICAAGWWARHRRGLAVGLYVLALAAAQLSDSLAAKLALIVALAVFVGFTIARRPIIVAIAVALALAFLAPIAASHLPTSRQVVEWAPLPNSALHRLLIWRFAGSRIDERPILGWGLDASREIPGGEENELMWSRVGEPFGQQRMPLHPHSAFVQIWLETGAVGACFGLFAMLSMLVATNRHRPDNQRILVSALVGMTVIAAISYGLWQSWWLACVFLNICLATTALVPARDIAPVPARDDHKPAIRSNSTAA